MTDRSATPRFDGEVVVVTGAGRGLGRGYAELFARHGADVVVNDLDPDAVDESVGAITARGGSAIGVAADVAAAEEIVDQVLTHFGRLDVLVNNAGIAHSAAFGDGSLAQVERLIQVHTLGTVAMTEAAWPALSTANGRLVNITSGAVFGLPLHTAYASAKGAILGFTRALAREPGCTVRVNGVMPMARTRMFEAGGGTPGSPEDDVVSTWCPPESVAPVVVFLGWSGVPCNGQIFEVAGTAVSRVVFAAGPTATVNDPVDMSVVWDVLNEPRFTEIENLESSMMAKLSYLMANSTESDVGQPSP